jgi:hypothetical protein
MKLGNLFIKSMIRRISLTHSYILFQISLKLIFQLFAVNNIEKFQTISNIHNISKRYTYNLHVPNTNLSKYQKGVYYAGIKLFNNLPPSIRSLSHNMKTFKLALKEYLLSHSFYSIVEFTSTKNSQLLQTVVMLSCVIIFEVILLQLCMKCK